MDLEDAVRQVDESIEAWAVHLHSPVDSEDMDIHMQSPHEKVTRALSFGNAPREMIIKAATTVGTQTAKELKKILDSEEETDEIKAATYESLQAKITSQAIPVFAVGYNLGSSDYSSKPRSRETYFNSLKDIDSVKALTDTLSTQYFLVEMSERKSRSASDWVSKLFSSQDIPKTVKMVARFAGLAGAMVFTEMFTLGYLSRQLLEENVAAEQTAVTFDEIVKGLQED